jgi:alkylmercury lyase
MSTKTLGQQLTATTQRGLDTDILLPLLRLLAQGDPVPIEGLAKATGLDPAAVRERLAAVPDTEYDEAGAIIGQGLTLRPTPHRFTVDGQELYTWCALDTLIFPTLLGRPARVESVSAGNGAPIRLRMDPANGVTGLEPATAVVTVLNPEEPGSIRSSFCNQVHFFTDPEDSRDWLAEHPAGQALPVTEAYALGRSLASTFAAEPANVPGNACGPTDCCC